MADASFWEALNHHSQGDVAYSVERDVAGEDSARSSLEVDTNVADTHDRLPDNREITGDSPFSQSQWGET